MEAVLSLVNAVFFPYVPYLLDYAALQTGFLTENLKSIQLVSDITMYCAFHNTNLGLNKSVSTQPHSIIVCCRLY